MIHNGIEYGMMQAYAEGFDILRNANSEKLSPKTCATISPSATSPRSGGAAAWSARGCSTSPPMALVEDPTLASTPVTSRTRARGDGR